MYNIIYAPLCMQSLHDLWTRTPVWVQVQRSCNDCVQGWSWGTKLAFDCNGNYWRDAIQTVAVCLIVSFSCWHPFASWSAGRGPELGHPSPSTPHTATAPEAGRKMGWKWSSDGGRGMIWKLGRKKEEGNWCIEGENEGGRAPRGRDGRSGRG